MESVCYIVFVSSSFLICVGGLCLKLLIFEGFFLNEWQFGLMVQY